MTKNYTKTQPPAPANIPCPVVSHAVLLGWMNKSYKLPVERILTQTRPTGSYSQPYCNRDLTMIQYLL